MAFNIAIASSVSEKINPGRAKRSQQSRVRTQLLFGFSGTVIGISCACSGNQGDSPISQHAKYCLDGRRGRTQVAEVGFSAARFFPVPNRYCKVRSQTQYIRADKGYVRAGLLDVTLLEGARLQDGMSID